MASREVWSTAKARAWRNLPAQPSTTRPLVVTVFSGMVILALKSLLENVEKVCVLRSCDIPIEAPIKKRSTHRSYWMPPSARSKVIDCRWLSSQFSNQTFDSFKMQRHQLDKLEPLLQRRDDKKEGRLDFSWGKTWSRPVTFAKKAHFWDQKNGSSGGIIKILRPLLSFKHSPNIAVMTFISWNYHF